MQTKLTLRLEREVIEQAKEHARKEGKSLSRIVSDYLKVLTRKPEREELLPHTKALAGLLKGSDIDEQDYKKHLEEKYL
ncbi:MAG: antitoxin [Candidatus Omnitrophica bacterium]|nr:antitoxin [Candidatus Omnitrophota bacterium]MCA9418944.1 antitoxin [Candidatus Omnitrophota bacterium]MCA9429008.1 antitoxin [Candidatus Omnitrophota bacterium]MCB9768085.1 antitoxin [Candidatus Omnitrophota bacterium]